MKKLKLKNGIDVIIKNNKNTPRTAIVMYAQINKDEEKAGLYYLITQLMMQGTKNKSSEELAQILDENAIDLSIEKKADYIRFKLLCLNEDVDYALEIFEDIIENSTFEDYKKEALKIEGELSADLDSAKIQAQDNYYRTLFKDHPYGIGREEIISQIESITKEDIIEAYKGIKYISKKTISVAGDIDEEKFIERLNKHLSNLRIETKEENKREQIFQGWLFPTIFSPDYPAIILLNTIMGASGLSSRLFLELREKQGLAYTVRSVYEPFLLCADFFVYIATEPKNIKTSIDGFAKEIKKIMTEIISEEELNNAKNNAIGKRQFYQETNLLEASLRGYYEFLGLGYDWEEKLIESIKNTTKEQIITIAKKYFSNPNVLSVLAPTKYLKEADLL